MEYLRGFVPWIAFAALSAVGWQWGALAGLALALLLVRPQGKDAGVPDPLILERGTAVFFAALAALALSAPHSALRHYTGALSLGWLAAITWITLAVRRPFTLGAARRRTPQEIWHNPVFLRVNVVLSTVWAVAFTVTAGALAVVAAARLGSAVSVPVQAAGFVLPAVFSARYPDRIRARAAAAAATAGAATARPQQQEARP